jgi:hypothetical protein
VAAPRAVEAGLLVGKLYSFIVKYFTDTSQDAVIAAGEAADEVSQENHDPTNCGQTDLPRFQSKASKNRIQILTQCRWLWRR